MLRLLQDALWLAVVAALGSAAVGQEAQVPVTISVASFGRGNIIGYLGQPLGTVLRVTGFRVDGVLPGVEPI